MIVMPLTEPRARSDAVAARGHSNHMSDTRLPWTDSQADDTQGDAKLARGPLRPRLDTRREYAAGLEAQPDGGTRALADAASRLQAETAARERTEAALHEAQKLQAVGQLASGIAHDFNNTLATILGNLELMERCLQGTALASDPVESERLRRLIERAMEAVQQGARLTALMQGFARRQNPAMRPNDLHRLVEDLLTLSAGTLGRGVRVQRELHPDLWPVLADPGQLGAALLALWLNARDAMPQGGELRIAAINARETDAPASGEFVRIMIRDTGIGMPPDVLARAFEPFFSTKGSPAAGLGLTQVDNLARQCGGSVRAASTPGQGTEIVLLLPRA
jgi:signal transduction histidine kinase